MRRLRRAHQRCARQQLKRRKKFKQRAIAAGAAAAITLGAGVALNTALAHTPDPHELPVSQDADGDLLADAEEIAIDSDVLNPDQNLNEIPDGVELAKRCFAIIEQLPWDYEVTDPNQTYKWVAPTFGLETCGLCEVTVQMGPAGIVNPRLGISVDCPLIAIHYMEHGSFSHLGDVHSGRIDVPALVQALELPLPYDPKAHQLPVAEDTDGDLLADNEEKALAYLPFNPDQNRNDTLDGVELAKLCAADINDLPTWDPQSGDPEPNEPYKTIVAAAFGIETCAVCGKDDIVMIEWEVVNPENSIRVQFTDMGMHYLKHGSFTYHSLDDWSGKGRLDVPTLLKALELRLPCEPNDHQLPVAEDADADLLSNKEEFAIGYRVFKPDQNRTQIPDGVELARRCAEVVSELPSYPLGNPSPDVNQTYKMEHALDGLEQCDICGQWIHMGGWEIINPKLGLHYPDSNDPLDAMFLPDLALHYMQHGSFDCYGDDHRGRVDLQRLMVVIELRLPDDPNEHQLPLDYVVQPVGQLAPDANDLDGDLLTDSEELAAGYNLYDPDQDRDLTSDGIKLANQCAVAINELPVHDPYGGNPPPKETYKIEHEARGLETCGICGAIRNMGYVEIINPQLHLSIEVPFISIHYMEQGSFSHFAYEFYAHELLHAGRIDVPLLVKILEMPRRCGDLGTIYLPGDLNGDCSENFKDIAEVTDKWLECTDPGRDECDKL